MKLREKFKTEFSINTSGESGRFADKCESIADEFAIGFAGFLYDCALDETLNNKSLKELLEIYKKVKNL